MSVSPPPHPTRERAEPRTARPAVAPAAAWAWVILACAALVASGAVRSWQARRVERKLVAGAKPAFDLDSVPMTLGPWVGQTTAIDPMIARGTGADRVVTRRYVHQDTGASVDLILLYGPAVNMYIHLPELCYPTAGFSEVEGPALRTIGGDPGRPGVPFRSLVYGKGEGPASELQEVYYTWRYNERWSPDVGNQKFFERIPGMYKVHLARVVRPGERRQEGNPCEAFLRQLIPDMEARLAGAAPGPTGPAPTTPPSGNGMSPPS